MLFQELKQLIDAPTSFLKTDSKLYVKILHGTGWLFEILKVI